MFQYYQMQNHSNEFRYARVLCILGLIILTVLGLSELGSETHQESRRRLGLKNRKNIFDNANPIVGLEGKKFEFASQKQKAVRGVLGSLAVGLGCIGASIATLNPIPGLFCVQGAALGATLGMGIETKITYEFKYGPVNKGGKDRVLIKLTKPNKDEEYAYLTDIIINKPLTYPSEQEKSKMTKRGQERRANYRHSATFKMNSTEKLNRVCNRTVYYMHGKFNKSEKMEKSKGEAVENDFGTIIQALARHCYVKEDVMVEDTKGFALGKKKRKKFLKISCEEGFTGMLAAIGMNGKKMEDFFQQDVESLRTEVTRLNYALQKVFSELSKYTGRSINRVRQNLKIEKQNGKWAMGNELF